MDLLLVGASVRAAAASLCRIGCRPVSFDLYADADLVDLGPTTQLRPADYPSRIWDRVAHLEAIPWLYTGAIENHPDVVATLSRRFRLLGNGPAALRGVRDPIRLAEVVRRAGFDVPESRLEPSNIPADGSWLAKPLASGGGERIVPWLGEGTTRPDPAYYQRRVGGLSASATFVRGDSGARLIGITRQYHGRPGNPFAYRGSLGPCTLPEPLRLRVERLGRAIGDSFGLLGLYGIDLIVDAEHAWLIEVNPRYTASVEVLEHALGRSILADHLRAFGVNPPVEVGRMSSTAPPRFVAKSILFARSSGPWDGPTKRGAGLESPPRAADIPRAGTEFEPGQPILTIFGQGTSAMSCRLDLARQRQLWKSRIRVARP